MIPENCKIVRALEEDSPEILALYRSHLYGPADWNEYYPNEDTISFDLSRNALYVMKDEKGQIIAAISIDSDPEVDKLSCWSADLVPEAELSRLCVREDWKNRGIAREMMQFMFPVLKEQGYQGIHILVRAGHEVAVRSYSRLGFEKVGECNMFDKDFWCFERKL